jgi:hypothetical protein
MQSGEKQTGNLRMNSISWTTKDNLITILRSHDQFHPIHGEALTKALNLTGEAELRSYINNARSSCTPICSSSEGYWLATSSIEIKGTIHDLSSRASAINRAVAGLKVTCKTMEKQELGFGSDGTRFQNYDLFYDLDNYFMTDSSIITMTVSGPGSSLTAGNRPRRQARLKPPGLPKISPS